MSSPADIAIYGGAAGGGKTFGLLLEPLRHIHNPLFSCVIFRRESPQITNPGGLWDESQKLYPLVGGTPTRMNWAFRSGAKIVMSHLQHEKHKLGWQGAQVPLICFDELPHFTREQFFYMLSRVRSMSGIRGYIRATCNPDPDSWVKDLIRWWLDDDGRFADASKSGKLRWFINIADSLQWFDTEAEATRAHPTLNPKSVTFIHADVYDNQILMKQDPGYLSNLQALSKIDRERLLHSNWAIRPQAGLVFNRAWFKVVDKAPASKRRVRYWDRAATPATVNTDPDWTVGLLMSKGVDGEFYVEDVARMRGTAGQVKAFIRAVAEQDGRGVEIVLEQDPGQAGKFEIHDYLQSLAGFSVCANLVQRDKLTRAKPVSSRVEAGSVKFVRAQWNAALFSELEAFDGSGKTHDDQVDALSGAYNRLSVTSGVASAGKREY